MREPRPKQCKRKEGLVLFHITVQIAGKTLPQEIHVCGERHFRRSLRQLATAHLLPAREGER